MNYKLFIPIVLIFTATSATFFGAHEAYAGEKELVSAQVSSFQSADLPALITQAANGEGKAHLALGELYYQGRLLPQDHYKAARHYYEAALLGSSMAQNSLGYLHDQGLGVHRNRDIALAWYTLAAKQNEPVAMFNLGALYESGEGIAVDTEKSIYWYRRAAELGYVDAIAVMEKTVAIHDTRNVDTIANFLEDVLPLLPKDLALRLDADANTLYKKAQPDTSGNYWAKAFPTKETLIRDWALIQRNIEENPEDISRRFGSMVPLIIEAAMTPISYDPLNKQLQTNVINFQRTGSHQRYFIAYPGYKHQTIPILVERLIAFGSLKKDNLYPQLVILTADLWTTIWQNSQSNVMTSPYNILRCSVLENFQN